MRLLIYLILILSFELPSQAQTVIEADVKEDFATQVKVSGTIITGLAIGALETSVNPLDIHFASTEDGSKSACLRAKTRDGQYWAESKFSLPDGPDKSFRLEPVDGWKHMDQLKKYKGEDYAALVRLGMDCDVASDAVLMPVYVGDTVNSPLTVSINSQRAIRLSAKLVNGEQTLTGVCRRLDSATMRSTAFDYVCTFANPEPGTFELQISRRLRTSRANDVFKIYIPSKS